jgi:hypothetical protein
VVGELRAGLLDSWKWATFVGEQGGLAMIYSESPDTAIKRCIGKASQPASQPVLLLGQAVSAKAGVVWPP